MHETMHVKLLSEKKTKTKTKTSNSKIYLRAKLSTHRTLRHQRVL